MKSILIFILLSPSLSFSISCEKAEMMADVLKMDGKNFMNAYRKHKLLGNKDELRVMAGDVNQARKLAYKFPPLKDLGFPPVDKSWNTFVVTMESSSLKGMKSGKMFKNAQGDIATIRLDYDPVKGAHYNIDVMKRTPKGKESFKISIEFDCEGKRCTPDQVIKMAQRIN